MLKERVFELSSPKPSADNGFVNIGLTKWLGSEEISTVAFTAQNFLTKQNETANVLTAANCTYTATIVKPYIKGGIHGETYIVKMVVTTDGSPASILTIYLKFTVNDNIPKLPNY